MDDAPAETPIEERVPTPAERYHAAMGLPSRDNPNAGTPGEPLPMAPPEDRYLLLLDALGAVERGDDPQRTGPAFTPRPGEFPLGSLVTYTIPDREMPPTPAGRPRRTEPAQSGVGVVIEYALVGPAEQRPHILLCEDGTYRQVEFAHLSEA